MYPESSKIGIRIQNYQNMIHKKIGTLKELSDNLVLLFVSG
jgi:hypothetical protein